MDISDQLRCVFSAQITEQDGSYRIDVPKQEVRLGGVEENETYRVAILRSPSTGECSRDDTTHTGGREGDEQSVEDDGQASRDPPVTEGERRDVEIENLGDQGDGITRVERGFVVIVPDTEPGERVAVEITDVRENVAFAEVVERSR